MSIVGFSIPKDRLIVLSSKAQDYLSLDDAITGIMRHLNADWGSIDESDKVMNDYNLSKKGTLISQYQSDGGVKFWVITEAGHGKTVVLLPDEYGADDVGDRAGYVLHGTSTPTTNA